MLCHTSLVAWQRRRDGTCVDRHYASVVVVHSLRGGSTSGTARSNCTAARYRCVTMKPCPRDASWPGAIMPSCNTPLRGWPRRTAMHARLAGARTKETPQCKQCISDIIWVHMNSYVQRLTLAILGSWQTTSPAVIIQLLLYDIIPSAYTVVHISALLWRISLFLLSTMRRHGRLWAHVY